MVGHVQHRAVRQRCAHARRLLPELVAQTQDQRRLLHERQTFESRIVECRCQRACALGTGAQAIAEILGEGARRNIRAATLQHALPFFGDVAAVLTRSGSRRTLQQCRALLRRIARRSPKHHAPHGLRPRDRQLRRDERAELITEHVDGPQSQAVQEIPDGPGEVHDRGLGAGAVRRAVTRQVRRIDAAVMTDLAQQ